MAVIKAKERFRAAADDIEWLVCTLVAREDKHGIGDELCEKDCELLLLGDMGRERE